MTYSHCPHLLDNIFLSDDPILSNLMGAAEEIERDLRFYWLLFQLGRIGPWEQHQHGNDIYLSDIWCKVFGVKVAPATIDNYVKLIDDEGERLRIFEARQKLQRQTVGTRWEAEYTLCGQRIRSIAYVMKDGSVAGIDQILEENG